MSRGSAIHPPAVLQRGEQLISHDPSLRNSVSPIPVGTNATLFQKEDFYEAIMQGNFVVYKYERNAGFRK